MKLRKEFSTLINLDVSGDLYSNISNTRKSVSSDFQTQRSRLEKRGAAEFFNQLPGVWKWEETLFLVFDISYISNSWLNTHLVLYFRAYEDLRVKHEPLLLITPQFETPLPPLQPAVSVKY